MNKDEQLTEGLNPEPDSTKTFQHNVARNVRVESSGWLDSFVGSDYG